MYTILILGLTVGVALADVSLGYHYDRPTTSYGLPIYQVGGSNNAFSSSSSSSFPSGNNAFSVVSTYPATGNVYPANNINYQYSESSSATSTGPSFGTVGLTSGSNYNQHGSAGSSGSNSHYNTGSTGHYNTGANSGVGTNYNSFNSGASSTSGLNSNYNTGGVISSTSGLNSNHNSGSVISGSGSNYNTANSVASGSGNYNAASTNYNSAGQSHNNAGNLNYNSGGSLSSSNFVGGSGSGSNAGSNYNYFQTGQSSGNSYIPNYQTIPTVTVDTSALDKIGNYYQSASSANQFISNHQSSHVQKQEYIDIVQSNQPAQVFKHYYLHAAPEEPEQNKPRAPIVLPPPQKHYKIIFIKAPVQPQPQPQIITVPQQNEEKTIVYVLVKKPEDAKNIVLPKFDQKAPTKPEVFFIKYNNKHDSQSLINNIVNDYNKGGVSATFSGAGASALTSKLGEEDTTANEGSSSSGAAAELSESDLASTIQSVFGNTNSAQSDSAVSDGSLSLGGATTPSESSSSSGASESSAVLDLSNSSGVSSLNNNSPSVLSLNFAPQTSSSDSIINDSEANSESSTNSANELNLNFNTGTSSFGSESSDTSKPSDNRAGDTAGNNNNIVNAFISNLPGASNLQNYASLIQPPSGLSIPTIPNQSNFIQNLPNLSSFGGSQLPNFSTLAGQFGQQSNPSNLGSQILQQFNQNIGQSVQSDSLDSGENKFGSSSSGSESNSGSASGSSSGFDSKYQFNTISTSQGVPHLTYGVPKFRS